MTVQLPKQRPRAKYSQFTAFDDCTRLRVLRIYPRCDQQTAIQFLDYVLQRLPFRVEVMQTDNGAEFDELREWRITTTTTAHTAPRTVRHPTNASSERHPGANQLRQLHA